MAKKRGGGERGELTDTYVCMENKGHSNYELKQFKRHFGTQPTLSIVYFQYVR